MEKSDQAKEDIDQQEPKIEDYEGSSAQVTDYNAEEEEKKSVLKKPGDDKEQRKKELQFFANMMEQR